MKERSGQKGEEVDSVAVGVEDPAVPRAPRSIERLQVALVSGSYNPGVERVDLSCVRTTEGDSHPSGDGRSLPFGVEGSLNFFGAPREAQPASEVDRYVPLSACVSGYVETEEPVEAERASHVVDDRGDRIDAWHVGSFAVRAVFECACGTSMESKRPYPVVG